ncbi:uncharacterized protein LOC106767054 isoform X1 [Vigna radiata var. radiata]|uniref:Uncharacterized protein LOC106767054 isoform X1 n=1 Tax=Vigna radiata var. radiata TaxID=3916 RepID=A0A1S3UN40_VIGRR|nr:uncharacterized protein LOC106767054 isoform X1 [Vigna radiata var. radiata]
MASNRDSSDGLFKIRPRLADVTNCPSKRPFSLVSSSGGDSQFTKQMRLGVESLAKTKIQMQLGAHSSHLNNEVLLQPKENQPILFPSCDDTSSSYQKPGSPSEGSEEKNPLGVKYEFGEKVEGIAPTDCAVESGDKDICVAENSGSPRCRAVQMPSISASNDSNFRGLKPCSGHKDDGASNPVTDAADIKSCTCSLCSKAAYIWSDLHYQDAKGRLSAIKKSQKEAKLIIQKFSGLEDTVMHGQHQSEESLNLELSLVHQWKSLFVQMQNMYAQESSQLESSFESLKDLRERCKTDLDSNDNSHREKQ